MLYGLCSGWSAFAIADFANQLGSLIASRPGGTPYWTVDELRVPDRPFGPALPEDEAEQPIALAETPSAIRAP
jgi:hypothetical protein